jgi:hypothetical protein
MAKIKVAGLPPVAKKVWAGNKELLRNCRALQASGYGQGTFPYETALDALKRHSHKHNLLLGHVHAIEKEYEAENP